MSKTPIYLPSGHLGFAETAKDFFKLIAPSETLFLRGGRVVELETSGDGALSLSIVTPRALQSRIENYGVPLAWRAGAFGTAVLKPTRLSLESAQVWLEAEGRKLLPHVTGICNAPVLVQRSGGAVTLLPKGYDKPSGLLITSGTKPLTLSFPEGIAVLEDVLSEFAFATPADKSRAVAALVSPALRFGGLLKAHFPLFAVEADASQAGKGYLLELIQTIYRESPSLVLEKNGGVGASDESLSQAMLTGRSFVQFDNVRGRISSQFLEAVLTCPLLGSVPARVPHKGEIDVPTSHFIFQLTSNGFQSTRDLANRSCIIRILKRVGFAFRRFAEGDLVGHVSANQPCFLGAVQALVREWVSEGCPKTGDIRGQGRFRQWAQTLDWIVQKCGLPPLLDGHERAQESVSNPALAWLRELALVIESRAELGTELSPTRLGEISGDAGLEIPGLHHDADEKRRCLVVGSVLARVFHNAETTFEVENFTVQRLVINGSRTDGSQFEGKHYIFERAHKPA